MMTPIGYLMIEHRLIERMIALLAKHLEHVRSDQHADPEFIASAVDFFRSYADRCHHGKEEDLLFRDLESKPLEAPLKGILHELIQEHVLGRQMVGKLAEAGERYHEGDPEVLGVIEQQIAALIDFYPRHIEKEDRHFFVPVMDCFTKKELANLLDRFHEFDRQLIHERYRQVVSTWEHRK
ncbi:MAG: hemerythrin domain-containing protein [Armatimonadia bacterium]